MTKLQKEKHIFPTYAEAEIARVMAAQRRYFLLATFSPL